MNLDLKIKSFPTQAVAENDVLTLKKVAGEEELIGRLSGYSDSELIDPSIGDDGYFKWFSPSREMLGNVFVRPTYMTTDVVTPVTGIGLFEGSFSTSPINDRYLSTGNYVSVGKYIVPTGPADKRQAAEVEFTNGTVAIFKGYSGYAYSFSESYNQYIQLRYDYNYLAYEFPELVPLSGVVLTDRYNNTEKTKLRLEYTVDGRTWVEYGEITAGYQGGNYLIESIELEEQEGDNGVTFFEEGLFVKGIRVYGKENLNVQIGVFVPFIDPQVQNMIREHKYSDLTIDPDSFAILETDFDVTLEPKASPDRTFNLENTPVDERRISLIGRKPFEVSYLNTLPFEEVNEFAPGVHATVPYMNYASGITLEAGSYLIKLEIEPYVDSIRKQAVPYYRNYNFFNVKRSIKIDIIDVIRDNALTEEYYDLVPQEGISFDFVDSVRSNSVWNRDNWERQKELLLSKDNPKNSSNDALYYSPSTEEDFFIQFNFKQKTKISGFLFKAMPGSTYPPSSLLVQGSDDGVTWSDLEELRLYRVLGSQSHFIFEQPYEYKFIKLVSTVSTGSPEAISRAMPISDNSNEEKPRLLLEWELTLAEKTTIGVRVNKINEMKINERKIDIYKLGAKSLTEEYLIDSFESPVSTYKILSSFGSDFIINPDLAKIDSLDNSSPKVQINGTSELTMYFPGPVRLWRVGHEAHPTAVMNLRMFTVSDVVKDVSHLQLAPHYPVLEGLFIADSTSVYSKQVTMGITTVLTDSNPYMLNRASVDTIWTSKLSEGEDSEHIHSHNEPLTLNGFFETLVTEFTVYNTFPTTSPKNVTIYYKDMETDEWIQCGKIDEQYAISIDGTARSGATDYETNRRMPSDGKRRYYRFDQEVTAKEFKFVLENGMSGRVLTAKEYGLCFIPEGVTLDELPDTKYLTENVDKLVPFTKVIPGGTYIIKASEYQYLNRIDKYWYVESVSEESE